MSKDYQNKCHWGNSVPSMFFMKTPFWGTKVSAKITEYHPENMPVKFNSAYYLVIIFK